MSEFPGDPIVLDENKDGIVEAAFVAPTDQANPEIAIKREPLANSSSSSSDQKSDEEGEEEDAEWKEKASGCKLNGRTRPTVILLNPINLFLFSTFRRSADTAASNFRWRDSCDMNKSILMRGNSRARNVAFVSSTRATEINTNEKSTNIFAEQKNGNIGRIWVTRWM